MIICTGAKALSFNRSHSWSIDLQVDAGRTIEAVCVALQIQTVPVHSVGLCGALLVLEFHHDSTHALFWPDGVV